CQWLVFSFTAWIRRLLSDCLIDELTPCHFCLHQGRPFLIQYAQSQLGRRIVGSQSVGAHLGLDVTKQGSEITLFCHPFSLAAPFIRTELCGLCLCINICALEFRFLP